MKTDKRNHNTRTAAVIVITAVIVLLSAGSYAWVDYTQHKSNEFSEGNLYVYDVTLVEDFEEVTDWKVEDGRITHKIRVKNTGTAADGGPVYVRLQLKEYMEIAKKVEDTYSDKRYMLDSSGDFIRFSTAAYAAKEDAITALNNYAAANFNNEYTFTEADLEKKQGYFDTEEYWYIITKAGDPNGQYGKFLLLTSGYENMESLVPGVMRSYDAYDPVTHHADRNGECDYTVHMWDTAMDFMNCTYGFHDYVGWHMSSQFRSINGWDGFEGKEAQWYLDLLTGWAYWGAPLEPGEQTTDLLDAVELLTQPGGTFYYTIHADLEAISADEEFGQPEPEPGPDKSEMPEINPVIRGALSVTGTGIAGASITVIFPSGTHITAAVNNSGFWIVDCPEKLAEGQIVSAIQTEPGKLPSDEVMTWVRGVN